MREKENYQRSHSLLVAELGYKLMLTLLFSMAAKQPKACYALKANNLFLDFAEG